MLKIFSGFLIAIVITTAIAFAVFHAYFMENSSHASAAAKSIYDFKMKDIDGNDVKLKKYKGNVLLVVNTASKCGYTPQYEGLQTTFDKYKERGFYVLGFPANNFGGQEPGTAAEIKEFCTLKYKVTFPMFAKISVVGQDQDPLYSYLTSKETNPAFAGDITWNFNKFLIDRDGKIVARFTSKDKPDGEAVKQAIEKYLTAK